MDRETLRELRDVVVEHHLRRLAHDAPPAWFMTRASELVTALMAEPVHRLVDVARLRVALDDARSAERVERVGVPGAKWALREGTARLGGESATIADIMGDRALEALDALLAHPDIVDETLLREVARERALEQVMQDVLLDALTEFSERTNPFIADWGLPSLLDQVPLFGRSTLKKAFATTRAEFDKRLEPEIRKFLSTFAKKSVEKSIELAVRRRGEPAHVAMRQQVVRRVLERPIGDLCWKADDLRTQALEQLIEHAAVSGAAHPAANALLEAAITSLWARWSDKRLSEVVEELGMTVPPPQPYAEAAWPIARAVLGSEPVIDELRALLDEAHEAWLSR